MLRRYTSAGTSSGTQHKQAGECIYPKLTAAMHNARTFANTHPMQESG